MRRLFVIITLTIIGMGNLFAQSYDNLWTTVDALETSDKPKDVIEEAKKILAKAKKEKCFPQMMKAMLRITEKECDLDPENFKPEEYEKLIVDIENDKTIYDDERAARLAVVHCIIAGQYNSMQDSFVHFNDDEAQENYPAMAKSHLEEAMKDMESLSRVDNKQFIPLVNQEEDGKLFEHDLLYVIIDKAIKSQRFNEEEKKDIYERAINTYDNLGNKNAAAIYRLRLLSMLKITNVKAIRITSEEYQKALLDIRNKVQGCEVAVDVDIALLNTYSGDERLAFARSCINKWKGNKRINPFKSAEAYAMSTHINAETQSNIIAGKPFEINFSYSNAEDATITIREYAGKNKNGEASLSGKIVQTRKYQLPLDETNQQRKANNLPTKGELTDTLALPAGHYVVVAECKGDKSVKEWHITSLRMVTIPMPDGKNMLVKVLDNETGRPVAGATVMCFEEWNPREGQKPKDRFVTDKNGEVIIYVTKSNNEMLYYGMSAIRDASKYGKASADITTITHTSRSYDIDEEQTEKYVRIFTDRSIYRPGQTVHGYAIVYKQTGDEVKVTPDTEIELAVNNPVGKKIADIKANSNALGSVEFEFELPTDSKLGAYRIYGKDYRLLYDDANFHVEEYKRPTFDIKFDKDKNEVKSQLGEKANLIGEAMAFSGAPIQDGKVHYKVEWCEETYFFWNNTWQTLYEEDAQTSEDGTIHLSINTELPTRVYHEEITFRVKVEVTDVNGEMEWTEYSFKVKNPDYKKDEKPKEEEEDELKVSTDEISETQDAHVTFKAKEKDALVFYYIISNNNIEQTGSKVLDGKELAFDVKYKKTWGDGVYLLVFYVRNGHVFNEHKEIVYKRPEKKLNMSWHTFRDNLQPGQKEEWVLTIKDHNNKVVSGAELLAVMYDASLDAIYPHQWDMNIFFNRRIKSFFTNITYGNYGMSHELSPSWGIFPVPSREYDTLINFEHRMFYNSRLSGFAPIKIRGLNSVKSSASAAPKMQVQAESMTYMAESADMTNTAQPAAGKAPATDFMRTNLSELAFFYPHLTTDKNGEVHIAFTLPDCLTEWKFMGLVHTENMDYGTITAKATAKKDFMVQPNMPRFLRTGDKAVIAAKIINMCEKDVNGKATLRILDAETEKEVMSSTVKFKAEAGKTIPVSFDIASNIGEGDYICEIIATDGTTSDGERNRLPIISTKVDVVENIPFYLDGASTKDIDISALFNQNSSTATDKRISIGYTDNPALPVFQQLQALKNPEHDNAPCYATALYSNLVLLDMSKVLGDRLKDFNAEESKKTADKAIEKLKKLQLSDGSWSWFEGMKGNYYITLSVAENMDRLLSYFKRHNASAPSEVEKMQKKALKYLDKQAYERYNQRKRQKSVLYPYNEDLRYLAIANNPNSEMVNKYLDEFIKEFRNLTIYGRAKGVTILKKYDRDKQAKRFLESVKQYSVFKEGFGRHFATDLAYYSWMDYRIPTQLAAMRSITAYEDLQPEENHQYLIDMQLWLLRQKQTQVWDNPMNAIDVADFLLTNNPEVSLHEVTVPELILDGKQVLQDSIYGSNNVKNLKVSKTSPGISWGHVRSTFKEEVSNLQSYSSGELTIERKIIREGNKVIIRHILHADRDMDFVNVMSQHAACLEPMRSVSGYQWMGGRGCYLEVHDSYINLFFDKFTRGTTTIDMEYYIAREGNYKTGYASIECSYAPEFGAHTKGEDIKVGK